MLEPFRESDKVANIIGIDPGSQTLGLSVLSFDVTTLEIVSTQAQTFIGDKLPFYDPYTVTTHGERLARIYAHRTNLFNILCHYRPITLVCESPFFNPRRPNAYAALLEVMAEVRNGLRMYDPYMTLITIDPPTVKKAVGAAGNADKEGVFNALLKKQEELKFTTMNNIQTLDEHSVDAVAVAYCRYNHYLNQFKG